MFIKNKKKKKKGGGPPKRKRVGTPIMFLFSFGPNAYPAFDCVENDVTIQIPALQQSAFVEDVGMQACAVEIKPGKLRASLIYTFRRAWLPYNMATFIATKGLFHTV